MADFADLSRGSLTVRVSGRSLDLTPYEHRVLSLLIADAAAGKDLTPLSSLDLVAPPAKPGDQAVSNVLQVIVYRIRRKLKNAGSKVSVVTHRARGYALTANAPATCVVQTGNADLVPAQHQTLGSPA